MTSKYSSAVFVTFLLVFSLAKANPITSILQLPAQLGNFISEKLMILTKLPIISSIVGGPTTTPAPTPTIIPVVYAPTPSSSSQVPTASGGADVTATAGDAAGTSPNTAAQTPLAEVTIAPVNQPPASSSQVTTAAGGADVTATAGDATGTSPNTFAAPGNQSPSSSAAPPPAEGMSEASIVGDVSATDGSAVSTESTAENTS